MPAWTVRGRNAYLTCGLWPGFEFGTAHRRPGAHVLLNVGDTHCRGGPERIAMCRCGSGVGSGRPLVCRMVKDDQNPRLPSSQNVGHAATLPAGSPLNRRRTALSGHRLPPTAYRLLAYVLLHVGGHKLSGLSGATARSCCGW